MGHRLLLVALVLGAFSVPGLTLGKTHGSAPCVVGREPDGAVVLPTNQVITPAGRQVEFAGRPNAVALRPGGRTATFLTATAPAALTVVDLRTARVIQTFDVGGADGGASFAGLIYAPDGQSLHASDARGAITVVEVAPDGRLGAALRIPLPDHGGTARPAGLALAPDGRRLYVALNRRNTVGEVDLLTRQYVREIAVGNAPHHVVVIGDRLYVSNEGGRRARPGDSTAHSSGTDIVVDPTTGLPSTGTVSVVDLVRGRTVAEIPVGLRPTALFHHQEYLYVANTNSDTISVIDTRTDEVLRTIDVRAFPNAPWGSSPTAIVVTGNGQVLVALAGNNALAVYDWRGPSEPVSLRGLLPVAWHPSDLAIDTATGDFLVANAKGVGSLGTAATRTNGTGPWVHAQVGSASLLTAASLNDLAASTATVWRNNQWSTSRCGGGQPGSDLVDDVSEMVSRPVVTVDPPPITHVFYIIKENRTYDQVLGDLPVGNGDPSLAEFGAAVTPNQHALATEFGTLDNLYVSGTSSADGHQWVTQAYASDYIEQAFGDFSRTFPTSAGDALTAAPTGYLWDLARDHGKTVRVYGEYANRFEPRSPGGAGIGSWGDWYRDAQILRGERTGYPRTAPGTFVTRSTVPSLDAILDREFPPYTEVIPDIYRTETFLQDLEQYDRNGALPDLVMIGLMADHTAGTAPGFPTPRAMVADNDLALGRIVDAITHSRYWAESAIFVIEDDAQGGVDHVDGHRTTGFVISPYAKRGTVDSAYYTQIDVVRTIEQILGLPPMNQMDLAATPMWALFGGIRDLTPFDVRPNEIALDEMNPSMTDLDGIALAWSTRSATMGFGEIENIESGPDSQSEDLLNRAIWYGATGFQRLYPGDQRVLWPEEVSAGDGRELEDAAPMESGPRAVPHTIPT